MLLCAGVSIALANSSAQEIYKNFWDIGVADHSLTHWVNEGLMAIFFLHIGLELEREIYVGQLSNIRNALLPIFAAIGGMLIPAGIHLLLNYQTPTQSGAGIPMATDIAFALGALSLFGKKLPLSLKVFLTAFAVIDDLGAILTIAVFYSNGISFLHLGIAMVIFFILGGMNRFKVRYLVLYIVGGIGMWYFILQSGVHTAISGVLLAFAIPVGHGDKQSLSYRLLNFLHKPVAFLILPIFALANTAITIKASVSDGLLAANGLGIFLGLLVGKPVGIFLFSFFSIKTGICAKPPDMKWKHIVGLGLLGGIGFTMSIFIALLAFTDELTINTSKIVIIITSLLAAITGSIVLRFSLPSRRSP